jgi:hypothetical protein
MVSKSTSLPKQSPLAEWVSHSRVKSKPSWSSNGICMPESSVECADCCSENSAACVRVGKDLFFGRPDDHFSYRRHRIRSSLWPGSRKRISMCFNICTDGQSISFMGK